jgi:RNA-directed DNA polymerase
MGSRFVPTRRASSTDGKIHPEADGTTFTLLGFYHVWGKSRKGNNVVRQVTAKQRYARVLAAVTDWCRKNRHLPIPEQQTQLVAKMRGHYAYYGISGNF